MKPSYEVPILYISKSYHLPIRLFLAFILWSEIFTTIIGNAFGFVARLTTLTKQNQHLLTIITLSLAVLFSQFGFAVLVGTIYPLLGYLSLLFLAALLVKLVKKEK
jgi:uncharacterized membrane protein YkvI